MRGNHTHLKKAPVKEHQLDILKIKKNYDKNRWTVY